MLEFLPAAAAARVISSWLHAQHPVLISAQYIDLTHLYRWLRISINAINIQAVIMRPPNIVKSPAIPPAVIEVDKGICDCINPAGLHEGKCCPPVTAYVLPILPAFGIGWTSRYLVSVRRNAGHHVFLLLSGE